MIKHCGLWANSRLVPQPFGEDAHGSAGVGVDLGFAPRTGFSKAEAMENFDHQVYADRRADDGDDYRFANRLSGGRAAGLSPFGRRFTNDRAQPNEGRCRFRC